MKKTWPVIKKIFLVIFIIHVAWFLYFVFENFSDADQIKDFKKSFLIFAGIAAIIAIVYFLWLKKITVIKKIVTVIWKIIFTAYIVFFIYFLLGFILNPPITLTQIGSLLQGNGLSRDYISYNAMGSNIKLAVIASEDQRYPDHDGFDLKAIKLAIKYNKKHPGKPPRGASTISQQTAKNIFLFQGGGFIRKGPEVFFTFTIETGWTKRTILERYLNIAEMGRGIFGVQAAAKAYFNKDAKDLTRQEAAQIIACLPNPKKLSVKPLSNYVAARANAIMKQMGFLESDPDVQEIIK
ncbi:MAG: monofunctional biosynthetic peptidoglycan transglycosylase [Ferruginibacter sp.]